MIYNCSRALSIIFKALCGLAAFFMVIFWVIKFQENEDVSSISYTSYETDRNIIYPQWSVCITEPFIYQNLLWTWHGNDSLKHYRRYIAGESTFRKEYAQVGFFNVTLNLFDYVKMVKLYVRNVTINKPVICTAIENCTYVTFKNNFNGLSNGLFIRCFAFDINLKATGNVKALGVIFKQELRDAFQTISRSGLGAIYLGLNYPGQMLRNTENYQSVGKRLGESLESLDIKSSSVEILRRRNKNDDPCFADWINFDESILKKHHETVGCSPPYHQSDKPVCTTKKKLLESRYEINEIGNRYYPAPCEELTNFVFAVTELPFVTTDKKPSLHLTYPEKIKIIQQIKSVDLHSLIGNIGGYIGLFLGKPHKILYNGANLDLLCMMDHVVDLLI